MVGFLVRPKSMITMVKIILILIIIFNSRFLIHFVFKLHNFKTTVCDWNKSIITCKTTRLAKK